MRDVAGKVAFITGGASGIGLGMAQAFLEAGIRVCIADYSVDHIEHARGVLGQSGDSHFLQLDVTDRTAMASAVDQVVSRFGTVHILCNNAGIGGHPPIEDAGFADWDRIMAVNLGGVINGLVCFLPQIKAQGQGGHVVNTCSINGFLAIPGDVGIYSASKFAVRGIGEALRPSLVKHRIGVTSLCPGLVRTNIFGTMGDMPEDHPLFRSMAAAFDPLVVGRLTLDGIRQNAAYVFPNGEFRDPLRKLDDAILAHFPEGPFPEERLAMERDRVAMMEAYEQGLA